MPPAGFLRAAVAAGVAAVAAGSAIPLNAAGVAHVYDGHGALSAGASSRALRDYPEPQRSQILDYLFKPNFGAALHQLKVEIGGDCQSTDGTEPSHMHNRGELSCSVDRGYELWLLQQAKARNPGIQTFALSWGVPRWVGNGSFFSADNVAYQVAFATCVKQELGFGLDYIGIWNERSWGTPDYVEQLRGALDAGGFGATRIVLPDGGSSEIARALNASSDPAFNSSYAIIGAHYPCDKPLPAVNALGKAYWASEDFSTVAGWAGAGCWGASLVRNYVRMNQTSTIAWSLIWSVYAQLPYFGNGLMYAYSPWSGSYEVNQAVWTTAHFTQFTAPGWHFLSVASQGSGALPGGGNYATLVPPTGSGMTVILESLQGDCLRCKGAPTSAQSVTFQVTGGAGLPGPGTHLYVWFTNATVSFAQRAPVTIAADGSFTVFLPADSIMTLTTVATGSKGGFPGVPIPPSAPFPLPYADDFSGYPDDALARYFSDQAGSFAVRGGQLLQVVPVDPGPNAWVNDNDPLSLIGDAGWGDVAITVTARFNASAAGNPAAPRPVYEFDLNGGGVDGDEVAAARAAVPARLAAHGVTADQLGTRPGVDAGRVLPTVAPCDARSPYQRWALGAPAHGYVANAVGAPGLAGTACLEACPDGRVLYGDCVTRGAHAACGAAASDAADNYASLRWAVEAAEEGSSSAGGRLVTAGGEKRCLRSGWDDDGGDLLSTAPCAEMADDASVTYDAATQQLRVGGGGRCLSAPVPPVYAHLCGRITGYSGFKLQTVPGYCLQVHANGTWALTAGPAKGVVASGAVGVPGGWDPSALTAYTLSLNGNTLTATAGGARLGSYTDDDATYAVGLAAVGSGYHYAAFDDFRVAASSS